MTVSQDHLRDQVARRIRANRPDLALHGLATLEDLLAAQEAIGAPEAVVVSVLCRFDLRTWIPATCTFAASLAGSDVAAWRRSFTRTVFLAGNPDRLGRRFSFAHVAADGSVAWTAPAAVTALAPLSRLLRLFQAPRGLGPQRGFTVTVDGAPADDRAPVSHGLYIATAGVTIDESIVNLSHLLVEAVLDGVVVAGDRLVVRPVPRLVGITEPFEVLRAGVEPTSPGRLRAYAGLTKEIEHV